MNWKRPLGMAAIAALCAAPAYGQLRICNYNILASGGDVNTGLSTVLQGMGNDNTAGFAKPIDILLVQETETQATTTQQVVDALNTLYGANTYGRGTIDAASSGGGRTGIVYRLSSVSLVAEAQVGTWSSSGAARAPMRYQFRPAGYSASADFYIYNSHYKASQGFETRRMMEAAMIRANADALGASSRIIYGGDFNSYTSSEIMFGGQGGTLGLQSAGNGQAYDPANRPGNWHNSSSFISIQSQAPAISPPSGFVGGGLNDRFDIQYVTDDMMSGEGVAYINGSYHTFMNNGSIPLSHSINEASNTALPSLPNRAGVLSALTTASDHLPLIVDYQIPARMSLSVGTVASQVIVGAALNVNATVTNTATVISSLGADELDYSGTTSGKLTGSLSGSANAAPSPVGNLHSLSLNTLTPGPAVGTVSVTSTSQGAASASLSSSVSTTVLAHANPTLSTTSNVDAATIDFGIHAAGAGSATLSFNIGNVADASGFTAGLKLTSISGTGATAQLSTNASTFANLAAGSSNLYSAMMSLGNYGTFSATYTFATADQDLPGATARENLLLTLNGVVALGGDANLDGFVETSDFNTLAGNFGAASATWNEGDFNRDALVDSMDFAVLAGSYGQRVNMAAPSLGAVVPEPSALGVALIVLAGQVRRRK